MWKRSKIRITVEEYNSLLKKQNGVCAICKKPESQTKILFKEKKKELAVDHDHKTGKIRGLLCQRCNSRILFVVEKHLSLVEKAKEYLNGTRI